MKTGNYVLPQERWPQHAMHEPVCRFVPAGMVLLLVAALLGACAADSECIRRAGAAARGKTEEGLAKLQEAVKAIPTTYRTALRWHAIVSRPSTGC